MQLKHKASRASREPKILEGLILELLKTCYYQCSIVKFLRLLSREVVMHTMTHSCLGQAPANAPDEAKTIRPLLTHADTPVPAQ